METEYNQMSSDRIADMFERAVALNKSASDASDDDKDYPGNTPPRNRPGGELYDEERALRSGLKPTVYKVGGVDRTFYTIASVAAIFDRKPVTIRSWEDKGILPKPKFRTPTPKRSTIGEAKGRRLYTQNQVDFMLDLAKRFNMREPRNADWDGFRKAMRDYPND